MKRGLSISIGCNLKKYKSIQRFAPFTSTPIIGTNAKKTNETANNGIISFISKSVFIIEIKIMIVTAKQVKIKCFVKKNKNFVKSFPGK